MVGCQIYSLKVFLVIRDLSPGGTQRQVVLLANALARSGQRVGILTFYDALDGYSSHLDANVFCHSLYHKVINDPLCMKMDGFPCCSQGFLV